LLETLNYEDMKEMCLNGHHYQSLAEMAMNKEVEVSGRESMVVVNQDDTAVLQCI